MTNRQRSSKRTAVSHRPGKTPSLADAAFGVIASAATADNWTSACKTFFRIMAVEITAVVRLKSIFFRLGGQSGPKLYGPPWDFSFYGCILNTSLHL